MPRYRAQGNFKTILSGAVVMGVAGSGKSTLAARLAQELDAALFEGDEHHPPANREKMRDGIALEDSDQAPWLQQLGIWQNRHRPQGRLGLMATRVVTDVGPYPLKKALQVGANEAINVADEPDHLARFNTDKG